jgi:hypothetical protein
MAGETHQADAGRAEATGQPSAAPSAQPAVIRTPDQRLRVFVSSTLQELADERAAVKAAISRLRLAPVLFELGARPHPRVNSTAPISRRVTSLSASTGSVMAGSHRACRFPAWRMNTVLREPGRR